MQSKSDKVTLALASEHMYWLYSEHAAHKAEALLRVTEICLH